MANLTQRRVKGRADDAVFEIREPVERIDKLAKAVGIEADSQRVDGEVAPVLVVLQRAVLDMWLTAVVAVAFLAGTNKLHLSVVVFDLRCAEVAEDTQMGSATELVFQGLRHVDAATDDDHIDVVGRSFEEEVTHIAPYNVALYAQAVGHFRYGVKDLFVEQHSQLVVTQHSHNFRFKMQSYCNLNTIQRKRIRKFIFFISHTETRSHRERASPCSV